MEAERVDELAMFQRALEHRRDRVLGIVFFLLVRIDAAAVDADPYGAVMLRRLINDEADLVLPGLVALMMVEVSGVVSDLVDKGGDQLGKPKVLLQVDRQVCRGALPDLGKRLSILVAVDGNPHHARTTLAQRLGLGRCRVNILRLGRGHALDRNGVARANGDVPNGTARVGLR